MLAFPPPYEKILYESLLEDALTLIPSAPTVPAVTAGPSSSRGPSTSSEAKLRNLLQQGIKLVDE